MCVGYKTLRRRTNRTTDGDLGGVIETARAREEGREEGGRGKRKWDAN